MRDRPLCVGGRIVQASRPSLTRASIRCRCPGTFPVDTGCGFPRPDRRISEDIAATPHCLDVMTATGRQAQFFPQLTNEDINNLVLRRAPVAVKATKKHPLSRSNPSAA